MQRRGVFYNRKLQKKCKPKYKERECVMTHLNLDSSYTLFWNPKVRKEFVDDNVGIK